MNVLIIGGTGILSTSVVNECINCHYNVTMLNRGRRKELINPHAELIKCDARNKEQIKSLLTGRVFDAVIDFLCYNKEQVIDSLSLYGNLVKQYIFISSAQVYNTNVSGILHENTEKPQVLWPYSVNKYHAELIVKEYCEKQGINYTIIRPGVNYDNSRIPYGIYPPMGFHWTICSRILNDKPIITWNHGKNRLNLTRSEDFARGTVGLIGNRNAYNEDFNVVGDYVYSWAEVLEEMGKYLCHDVRTIDIPVSFYADELSEDGDSLRGGRANDLICDNTKLKKAVPSFHTQYNLSEGLKLTMDYYRNNYYLQGYSYDYDANCDRIINKYLKSIGQKPLSLKCASFACANVKDKFKTRIRYFVYRYKENWIINYVMSHR